MGLFDKSCSAEKMIIYPQLYKPSQSGEMFNIRVFWLWIINSLVHSALLFWLPILAMHHDVLWMSGKQGGYLVVGNAVYTVSFIIVWSYLFYSCKTERALFQCCLFYFLLNCLIVFSVRRSHSLPQSWTDYKLLAVAHPLRYLGIYWTVVFVFNYLQVRTYNTFTASV